MASLLRNVGVNLTGFVAGKAAAAVTGIVLLRVLQPEAAGIYGAALGFAALFQCLADLGLSAALTRQVSARPKQASQLFSLAIQIQALQVAFAALGLCFFLWVGGAAAVPTGLVLLAFALTALSSFSSPVLATVQGLERFGVLGVLETTASLINAAALAGVILWGQTSPLNALQASLLAALLGAGLRFYGGWVQGLRFKFQAWSKALIFWKQSLPFAMVSVANQLYVRIDQALLVWILGTGPLGFYVAAVKLVDLLVPVLGAMNGPLYARLSALHGNGGKAARAQAWGNLNRALRYMAMLCLPLGFGASLLAGQSIHFLYGPGFEGSIPALRALAWVPALIGISSCLWHGLNAVGKTADLAWHFGRNLGLNIVLNLWLVPLYGIAASAMVSAFCEAVNLLAAWVMARRAGLAPSLRSAFWPALPAAAGMALGLHWILGALSPSNWPAGVLWAGLVLVGAAIYAVLLLALGFLGPDERQQLRRLWGQA